jgi:tetratricopeptide (TPR) repeat protein
MKYHLALIAFLTAFCHPVGTYAQSFDAGTTTRAVVVGISDYQDKDIPDLRFADRDAEAFANFLRSSAGGSLDGDHLKLLTNSGATLGQFAAALDWLMEVTKEGDNAIVYFSGHGDVEKKTLTQPGYLLCWDAPSRVYMGGGAFALNMLQEVVSTLSIQNKAKVVVITDACRSGNLAGQSVGGAQATAANLAKQYANEIKILSCQPNEYSIEGEQWGGGRGAFSFNLVDALYGLADGNNDLFVTLQEVGRYLEDHVTAEVAPVSQVPMVIGNRTERLASVDSKLLADLRSGRISQMKMLSPIETRGMEDDVLATVDTTVRELYRMFKQALKDKVFLEPATACADAYYERLMKEPKLARLHSTMRRNYAAALQDDAQQVLNAWIKSDPTTCYFTRSKQLKAYKNYPNYLERAASLLGKYNYMYTSLLARKFYFEGFILEMKFYGNIEKNDEIMKCYKTAAALEPQLGVAWLNMGRIYQKMNLIDSAKISTDKALAASPNWILANQFAYILARQMNVLDSADFFFNKMAAIDSNNAIYLYALASKHMRNKNIDAAISYLERILKNDPNTPCVCNNLTNIYLDYKKDPNLAETMVRRSYNIDSTEAVYYFLLAKISFFKGDDSTAVNYLHECIRHDSLYEYGYHRMAMYYMDQLDFAAALPYEEKAHSIDPSNLEVSNGLAANYWQLSQFKKAEDLFNKILQTDSNQVSPYINLGDMMYAQNRLAEAEAYFEEIRLRFSKNDKNVLAKLGEIYKLTKSMNENELFWKNFLSIDSTHELAYYQLAELYRWQKRLYESEQMLLKAIQFDTNCTDCLLSLALLYCQSGDAKKTEELMKRTSNMQPTSKTNFLLCCINTCIGNYELALKYLSADPLGPNYNYHYLQSNPDLALLRATPEWKSLMKKHFPDQFKD